MPWKRESGHGTGGHFTVTDMLRMVQMRAQGLTIEKITKEVGCGDSVIVRATNIMTKKGYVKRVGFNKYRLTKVGRDLLGGGEHEKPKDGTPPRRLSRKFRAAANGSDRTPGAHVFLRKIKVEEQESAAINDLQEQQYLNTTRELLLHPGWLDRFLKEVKEAAS